ncbi:MAG TPA: hypothetical protein PLN13_13605 [Bacteroidia bacterium]|nr:hypothetical protein [Bacteroidia bacterium]HRH09612.1 hypothetical protein [Bacteroidia bacterium]
MKPNYLLLFAKSFVAIVVAVTVSSCAGTKPVERIYNNQTTYEKTSRENTTRAYNVSYNLPVIKMLGLTTQNQTIGGVTILCELNSFEALKTTYQEDSVVSADPSKPGYDIFRVGTKVKYTTSPERLIFTIKVINNLDFPIEFNKVPVIFKMDGVGVSLGNDFSTKWNSSIAAGGETTTFIIPGPTKGEIEIAKTAILQIQNIPTTYDKLNGNLQNFETFKWVFEISSQRITKKEVEEFTYEERPVYKETCSICGGSGKTTSTVQCSKCQGTKQLKYTNYTTGKTWIDKCDQCGGAGYVTIHPKCSRCNGEGQIPYPKSELPKVSKIVAWNGWKVDVITKPAGASINVVDPETNQYTYVGASNVKVNWFSTNTSTTESFPIVLDYQGRKYKIMPYDEQGKPSSRIVVNFLNATGTNVKGGKIVD